MNIVLERYFGDSHITKSVMRVVGETGEELLRCEAREPRFAQYVEAFPGCSRCCLASGRWRCKVTATELSPHDVDGGEESRSQVLPHRMGLHRSGEGEHGAGGRVGRL